MTLLQPEAPEFRERFTSLRDSVFRLETLQDYEEDDSFEAFIAGRSEPPDPWHDAWCAQIAANVDAGKTVQRVHVVREPLTAYTRYELTWGYAPNVRAGEDVRIVHLDADEPWPSRIPQGDFWLFDNRDLFLMHYADGHLSALEHTTDPARLNEARTTKAHALQLGTPWDDYLAERPDLARHLELARAQ